MAPRWGGWAAGPSWGQQPEPLPPPEPGATRIAVPVEDNSGLDSRVAFRFGRAPYIAFVDVSGGEVKSVRIVENPLTSAPSGVGMAVVQWLINSRVSAVIAPRLGPNAAQAVSQAGITVYTVSPGIPLREALKQAGVTG